MPTTASAATRGTNCSQAASVTGIQKRMKPYVPSLRRTAANRTEPTVGAFECASGSQMCSGHSGVLTASPSPTRKLASSAVEESVSYTHLRAHETDSYLVCRLL